MSSAESTDSNIDVGGIILRAQKKLSSMFTSRKTIAPILDDDSKKLLNCAYHMFKEALGKKDSQKMTTRWIKIIVKIGILAKNDQFNDEEFNVLIQVQNKFRTLIKIAISFWTIDYTYDYDLLKENMSSLEALVQKVVSGHISDKNKAKITDMFASLSKESLMITIFSRDQPVKLKEAVNDLANVLETMTLNHKL